MSRPSLRPSIVRGVACIAVLIAIIAAVAGCHRKPAAVVAAPPRPVGPPRLSDVDLKSYHADEAGAIMIVMYHHFYANKPNDGMNRRPDTFRKDLQTFYDSGYRPISLSDLVDGKIDVEAGKTPVVLTFDDAEVSQFRVITGKDGQPSIDPDCAVGILETFHKEHQDWPMRATFFVLPKEGRNPDPFSQTDSVTDKLAYLLKNGYEIQNHTSTHSSLRGMGAEKVQWELATAVKDIRALNSGAQMNILSLPYGQVPRKDARKYLVAGESGGTSYQNKAIVKAAWRPVLSPITKASRKFTEGGAFCVYDPYNLERITPDPTRAKQPGTLEYWLKYFEEHPNTRYYSDGNPEIAAVPRAHESEIDPNRVHKYGLHVQLYPELGAKGTGSSGSTLSVQ